MFESIIKTLEQHELATVLIVLGIIREVRLFRKQELDNKLELEKLKQGER